MIFNKTQKKQITSKVVFFNSIFSQFMGLRFKKKSFCKNKGFIFPLNKSVPILIDMFFVSFPIDLIFLDKNNKVIEIKKSFRPWQSYRPKTRPNKLIELLSGHNIKLNDKLEINN